MRSLRIHRTVRKTSGGQRRNLLDRIHGLMLAGLPGHAANMRRRHDIGSEEEAGCRHLVSRPANVETSPAKMTGIQAGLQCGLIHQFAAGEIDEAGPLSHRTESGGIEQVLSGRQCRRQTYDKVGVRQDVGERISADPRLGRFVVWIVNANNHPDALRQGTQSAPDPAVTYDPQSFPGELDSHAGNKAGSGLLDRLPSRDATCQIYHYAEPKFCNRIGEAR